MRAGWEPRRAGQLRLGWIPDGLILGGGRTPATRGWILRRGPRVDGAREGRVSAGTWVDL
ncbi:hypothetical protein GCM10010233_05180 [Streptomyces pseudogriseolus]|nr:hypothetical protein GCM10010233_05180 [Streptomyces gancidicus]